MHYNWKCCSFYPNDFGASALTAASRFSKDFCNENIRIYKVTVKSTTQNPCFDKAFTRALPKHGFYIIWFAAKREIILLHLNGTCYFGFCLGYLRQGDV